MSNSRRDFIKKSSLLMGGMTMMPAFPAVIERALSIEAPSGSTFLDAEHIVFLMQENRSFDHCFGTLRGVRGFNDPRIMKQPNGLPVWFQTNEKHQIYGPFHLDIENTNITWLGDLPHNWRDMTGARNDGKMDKWLIYKKPGNPKFSDSPLTLGYYTRHDIPFYYALADAFTICDQHFCSSLTGTSANRSFFWSGTIREEPRNPESIAHVNNTQVNYKDVGWTTYPERLEKANVSWRVYQNELSLPIGLTREAGNWLDNFTDNNLEFHKQYNVRFHKAHVDYMEVELARITKELLTYSGTPEERKKLEQKKAELEVDVQKYSASEFEKLSSFEKAIHHKAFTTNITDPDYHTLEEVDYMDSGESKKIGVPKGDILHQFRQDVQSNSLPTVSWLAAPCNFSDHAGAPWFGAWYVSEVLDILTQNPEVWKKTIFVLTYDENDGYFDHIAPFVPPLTTDPSQGKAPKGMDTQDEWVTSKQEQLIEGKIRNANGSPIGLGYRVPMVIASPWSKGGWVNSEVCDITSTLQFLEYFIEKKTGKKIIEENISEWRRATCGNLTSVFQPANDLKAIEIDFIDRNKHVERILNARNKSLPTNFSAYTQKQVEEQKVWQNLPNFPKQEAGIKKACALPYTCETNMIVHPETQEVELVFAIEVNQLKNKANAAPFQVYAMEAYQGKKGANWNFTVSEEEPVAYQWKNQSFEQGSYKLDVHGSNGFYRSFEGSASDPELHVEVLSQQSNQTIVVTLANTSNQALECYVTDVNYSKQTKKIVLKKQQKTKVTLDYAVFNGWYDFTVTFAQSNTFKYQYAGHIESGKASTTDPYMASISI